METDVSFWPTADIYRTRSKGYCGIVYVQRNTMKPVRPTQILPAQLPLKTRGALAIASASIAALCLLVSGCEGPVSYTHLTLPTIYSV